MASFGMDVYFFSLASLVSLSVYEGCGWMDGL